MVNRDSIGDAPRRTKGANFATNLSADDTGEAVSDTETENPDYGKRGDYRSDNPEDGRVEPETEMEQPSSP
jgi:hypothetical protein